VDLRHVRNPSGCRGGDVRGLDKPGDTDASGQSSAIDSVTSKTFAVHVGRESQRAAVGGQLPYKRPGSRAHQLQRATPASFPKITRCRSYVPSRRVKPLTGTLACLCESPSETITLLLHRPITNFFVRSNGDAHRLIRGFASFKHRGAYRERPRPRQCPRAQRVV
jgi:hypothetical protein